MNDYVKVYLYMKLLFSSEKGKIRNPYTIMS